jgi:SAM-dependent methyltransferase
VTDGFVLEDTGTERILSVDGRRYRTHYSERLIRMLIARKGLTRAPHYFSYKETRGRFFLEPLLRYLTARGAAGLRVLEVGCSFGHNTEYLNDHAAVAEIHTFDVDAPFVEITRTKVEDLGLAKVRQVLQLTDEETTRLPFADGAFDLVLAVAVIEHLPSRGRRRFTDEYYRVLAPGGHLAVFDTPNRAFPLETHSVGLPGIQWLPPRLAYGYARLLRPARVPAGSFASFTEGAWRNAWFHECLPSAGAAGVIDVTEEAGYGLGFFRSTARSRWRRAALPVLGTLGGLLAATGRSPSLVLPYFNLVFRKR